MEGNAVLARAAPWPGEPLLPVSPDREISEIGGRSRPAHAVIARALLWLSGNQLILLARPKGATSRLEP